MTNIGANDKASNWLLEQKTLQRALTSEGKDLRDLIESKVSELKFIIISISIKLLNLDR